MFVSFLTIRQTFPITEYLRQRGHVVPLKRGVSYRGPCPFGCHDKTRRCLAVTGYHWYCHRCKQGGDVIDLHAKLNHLTVLEAADQLLQSCSYRNG